MNCPECQCDEISASGMCLWCGYQVNPPSAESGAKEDRDIPTKVEMNNCGVPDDPAQMEPTQSKQEMPQDLLSENQSQSPPSAEDEELASRHSDAPEAESDATTHDGQPAISLSSPELQNPSALAESASEPALGTADAKLFSQPGSARKAQAKSAAGYGRSRRILLTRTFSGLVDLVVMALSTGALISAAHFFWGMHVRDPRSFVHWSVLFIVIYFIYSLLFVGIVNQTIGMMITNLRVVDKDKRPPQISIVLGRSCAYLLSLLCLGIGLLWALFDPEHQCFHDRITGTRVVQL